MPLTVLSTRNLRLFLRLCINPYDIRAVCSKIENKYHETSLLLSFVSSWLFHFSVVVQNILRANFVGRTCSIIVILSESMALCYAGLVTIVASCYSMWHFAITLSVSFPPKFSSSFSSSVSHGKKVHLVHSSVFRFSSATRHFLPCYCTLLNLTFYEF